MRSAVLIALFAASAWCETFAGIWTGQIPARNGELQDVAFRLEQSGDKIGGKIYGDYRSSPIVEGKAEGDNIEFLVVAEEQAGNQINTTRLKFTGTLRSGILELTRERLSSTNAGNAGGVQSRNNSAITMRLRRLL
ncbi:MAG: hypothetical protein R2729_12570 [Bryobacteraceae bacterium]